MYLYFVRKIFCVLVALSVTGSAFADDFTRMFNGQDLTGWQTTGNWLVEDDDSVSLHPRPGEHGWQRYDAYLTTARKYGDFILDLEFKFNKRGNSGVFLRVGDRKNQVNTGFEVQILDTHGKANPTAHDCGGVIGTMKPAKNMVKPAGEWNHYTITCRGNALTVVLNGEQIIDLDLSKTGLKDRPTTGYIGFQDEAKRVWYRNVRIKEFPAVSKVAEASDENSIVIADFEGADFAGWTVEGTAFGPGPASGNVGRQRGVAGYSGRGLANSFFKDDGGQGTLTSSPFKIEHNKITFALGGGNHPGETCMNLIIDKKIVRSATGNSDTRLRPGIWDVEEFLGRQATIEVRDRHSGLWGWIAVDHIVQSTKRHVVATSVSHIKTDPAFTVTRFADNGYINNPISLTTDHRGGVYVAEVGRWTKGTEDSRRRRFWIMDELAIQSTGDRLALYKKWIAAGKFDKDYFTRFEDRIIRLTDTDDDGQADKRTVFANGFNHDLDGVGASILFDKGNMYYANIPNLWMMTDADKDGVAEKRKSLQDGFGLRIGVSGHDMHGLEWGPDGKLYWSIGDRAYNFVTANGRHLKDVEGGAVFRCDPDGSNIETFCTGNRNPQDLSFDQYGNLFTVDNNQGGGDRSRLCYLVEGGDYGWQSGITNLRTFWGAIGLNKMKGPRPPIPWYTEGLWKRAFDGQPAHVIPSVNFIDGGSAGLTFVPGLSLGDKYADHFLFSCCGRGIKSFAVMPNGAGFGMADYSDFWSGGYPLDTTFDDSGALYVADYVRVFDSSMGTKGDIFRVTHPQGSENETVKSAAAVLQRGFEKESAKQLYNYLSHRDQRVRREAQFELTARAAGKKWLAEAATASKPLKDVKQGEPTPVAGTIDVVTHRTENRWKTLAMGAPSKVDYADVSRGNNVTIVYVKHVGLATPHVRAGANGLNLPRLLDGIAPPKRDDTANNTWLDGKPSRLVMSFGKLIEIAQVHTYTRHVNVRSPQRFTLWGSNVALPNPMNADDWIELAKVNSSAWGGGGIHGSVVRRHEQPLGKFRFLMWDAPRQAAGMFLSEFDVYTVDDKSPMIATIPEQPQHWSPEAFDGVLLARLHGIWGLGQVGLRDASVGDVLRPLLKDPQAHVREQTAKVLGDLKAKKAGPDLVAMLDDDSDRARAFAATALGKVGYRKGIPALIAMLRKVNNKDPYLRHAAIFGLEQMDDLDAVVAAYADDPSSAVRLGVLLLLRRADDDRLVRYLDDKAPLLVAEAIRAIHDERFDRVESKLAEHLQKYSGLGRGAVIPSEMNFHRMINANYRIGRQKNAETLFSVANSDTLSERVRVAAVYAICRWKEPHAVDAIIGQLRAMPEGRENIQGLVESVVVERIENARGKLLAAYLAVALAHNVPVAAQVARKKLFSSTASREVRLSALATLVKTRPGELAGVLKRLLGDSDELLRGAALHALASYEPKSAERVAEEFARNGTLPDAQAAYKVLGDMKTKNAPELLLRDMNAFLEGAGRRGAALELVDACAKRKEPAVKQAVSKYKSQLSAEDKLAEFRLAMTGGDAARGEKLLQTHSAAQCILCHSINGKGGVVGPDLAKIGHRATAEHILESLVEPSAKILPGYGNVSIKLRDDTVHSGSLIEETASDVILGLPGDKKIALKQSDIVSRTPAVSSMPPVSAILKKHEIRDLIAYLTTLNEGTGK